VASCEVVSGHNSRWSGCIASSRPQHQLLQAVNDLGALHVELGAGVPLLPNVQQVTVAGQQQQASKQASK
jgi:hypothetical protein